MDGILRMNEWYTVWGMLKSVPSNRRLGVNVKKHLVRREIMPPGQKPHLWGRYPDTPCMGQVHGVSEVWREEE